MRSRPAAALLLALLLSLAVAATPAGATDLSGCWSGSWQSCTTGHKGPLFATFQKCGADAYRVEFLGRFFKIFPFRYSVVLSVVEDTGDAVTLAGSSFLGRLFGTFTYRATADACHFNAGYRSKKDSGSFRLQKTGS